MNSVPELTDEEDSTSKEPVQTIIRRPVFNRLDEPDDPRHAWSANAARLSKVDRSGTDR